MAALRFGELEVERVVKAFGNEPDPKIVLDNCSFVV